MRVHNFPGDFLGRWRRVKVHWTHGPMFGMVSAEPLFLLVYLIT